MAKGSLMRIGGWGGELVRGSEVVGKERWKRGGVRRVNAEAGFAEMGPRARVRARARAGRGRLRQVQRKVSE